MFDYALSDLYSEVLSFVYLLRPPHVHTGSRLHITMTPYFTDGKRTQDEVVAIYGGETNRYSWVCVYAITWS